MAEISFSYSPMVCAFASCELAITHQIGSSFCNGNRTGTEQEQNRNRTGTKQCLHTTQGINQHGLPAINFPAFALAKGHPCEGPQTENQASEKCPRDWRHNSNTNPSRECCLNPMLVAQLKEFEQLSKICAEARDFQCAIAFLKPVTLASKTSTRSHLLCSSSVLDGQWLAHVGCVKTAQVSCDSGVTLLFSTPGDLLFFSLSHFSYLLAMCDGVWRASCQATCSLIKRILHLQSLIGEL
jgi:hypothetical protein